MRNRVPQFRHRYPSTNIVSTDLRQFVIGNGDPDKLPHITGGDNAWLNKILNIES